MTRVPGSAVELMQTWFAILALSAGQRSCWFFTISEDFCGVMELSTL